MYVHDQWLMKRVVPAQVSQEPAYRISSLEGQVRLCQDKLAQALAHHDQLLTAERHHRYVCVLG